MMSKMYLNPIIPGIFKGGIGSDRLQQDMNIQITLNGHSVVSINFFFLFL